MTDALHDRLNKILPRVTSDEFIAGRGLGNEVAFHIFDYPPERELEVRDFIPTLLEHIPIKRPGTRVKSVDLFDFVLDHLRERSLLEKALRLQRERGDAALSKAPEGPAGRGKATRAVRANCGPGASRSRAAFRRRNRVAAGPGPFPAQQPSSSHGPYAAGRVLPRSLRRAVVAALREVPGQLLPRVQADSVSRADADQRPFRTGYFQAHQRSGEGRSARRIPRCGRSLTNSS